MATQLSEPNFALSFLQQLSARPIKYGPDYVAPPSTLGPRPLITLPPFDRPKLKRALPKDKEATVQIKFTSLKPPKMDIILIAPLSQTFHALKLRLAEQAKLNPTALRFLVKNKAISDSKSVQEVFSPNEEAHITVMVMKSSGVNSPVTPVTGTSAPSQSDEGDRMVIDDEEFWNGVREIVEVRYRGTRDKEDVYNALRKGYDDKFGSS